MKNLMLAICLMAAGLVSCSSCSSSTTVPPDAGSSTSSVPTSTATVPVPNPDETVATKNGWSVTLPGTWEKQDVCEPDFCPEVFANDKESLLVILSVDEFKGTLDEHVLMSVRGINEANATISEVREVVVNGTKFVLLKSARDSVNVDMWVTVADDFAVSLSCGGNSNNQKLCEAIGATLQHKNDE